jgi:hypothetical protein
MSGVFAKIKIYLGYAYGALVAVLMAAIYFLTQKVNRESRDSAELKSELSVKDDLINLQKEKDEADNDQDSYEKLRSAYLDSTSSTSPEPTDPTTKLKSSS